MNGIMVYRTVRVGPDHWTYEMLSHLQYVNEFSFPY